MSWSEFLGVRRLALHTQPTNDTSRARISNIQNVPFYIRNQVKTVVLEIGWDISGLMPQHTYILGRTFSQLPRK